MKNLIIILLTLVPFIGYNQVPTPLPNQHNAILLQNGLAHIGNGEVINKSSIGIVDGKIVFVKNALTYTVVKSEWDTIINIQGKQVYPGFIATNSTIGLTEIDAVRATNDFREVGYIRQAISKCTCNQL